MLTPCIPINLTFSTVCVLNKGVTCFRFFDESITSTHLLEFVADEREGLVDGLGVARQSHDALRARTVADVDLGAALFHRKKNITMQCRKVYDDALPHL